MSYNNNSHWSQPRSPPRGDYPDDDDDPYYTPSYSRQPPPQQAPGVSRRRPGNPPQQDPGYHHQDPGYHHQDPSYHYSPPQDSGYHHFHRRHRDDRDSWAPPGPGPELTPQLARRQSSTTTNSTSDYGVHTRVRRGRSSSASRLPRSKSTSPRRHALQFTPAPSFPQPSLSERESLARQRLQTTFETYVFNTLPTHLLRVADMTLVTRNEVWETFKSRVESLSDSHLAKLLLEQDEEARKLGVSVIDPQVLAPITEYIRSMISFAIFSHRWGNGEPLFHELPSKKSQVSRRSAPSGPGYQKLLRFCDKARMDYGCEYVWSDTCCINKENSTEVEEAILSMGIWYSEAGICIVHLGNSTTLEDFMSEPWFTRGWTLQELLLPRKIRFYGKDWSPIFPAVTEGRRDERERERERERTAKDTRDDQRINDKDNDALVAALSKETNIPEYDIRSFSPGCTRVSEKMRWASHRTTSRIEDMAYALLGLFDVSIPVAYGDGARAFYKLMNALVAQCTEPDLFAWAGKPSQWSLALPSSPQCYGPQVAPQTDLVAPPTSMLMGSSVAHGLSSGFGDSSYELNKLGLRIRLVLVPAYCEVLEPGDAYAGTGAGMARLLLTPALATAGQEAIQAYVSLGGGPIAQQQQPNGYGHGQGHGQGYGQGQGPGPSRAYEYDHDPRERQRDRDWDQVGAGRGRERDRERDRERERGGEREYALGVVDYDPRHGPSGYAALHAGRAHLCLVLERAHDRDRDRERRGKGWVRVARPGVVSVRFRESELLPVESACLLHRAS